MNFALLFIFSFIFLCFSFRISSKPYEKVFSIIYILTIGSIIALRTNEVPDTLGYLEYYAEIDAGDFSQFSYYTFEPGFQFFTHVVKIVVGYSPYIYFFSIVSIISLLLYDATRRILRYTKYEIEKSTIKLPLLCAIILFYVYYGIFYGGIAIRAGIAMSIYLEILSILCIPKIGLKNKFSIIVLFILAWLFHTSSLIILPILLLFRKSKALSKRFYLFILLASALIFFSRINVMIVDRISGTLFSLITGSEDTGKFALYADALFEGNQKLSFKYIFQLCSGFIFLLGNLKDNIYIRFLNVYILGVLLGAIFAPITMMYRVLDFFNIITFILYTLLFLSLRFHKNVFYISCGVLVFQLILIYRLIYAG